MGLLIRHYLFFLDQADKNLTKTTQLVFSFNSSDQIISWRPQDLCPNNKNVKTFQVHLRPFNFLMFASLNEDLRSTEKQSVNK